MILSLKDIYLEYGHDIIFNKIDFNITSNDKIALVGVNGSGKTSLLNIINNYKDLASSQFIAKPNLVIAYLKQDSNLNEDITILEYFNNDNQYEAKTILNKLGLLNHELKLNELSGGQTKRVALAKVLIQQADLLILDEPTNHLDLKMIIWLENYLINLKKPFVLISHDRDFLNNVCNKIIEIDQKQLFEYPSNYSEYLVLRDSRIQDQNATIRKQQSLLKKEKEWMQQGPKARSTKSKYRIEQFHELEDKLNNKTTTTNLDLNIGNTRLGKEILELDNISVGYDNNVLINNFSLILHHNQNIGIIGDNGSGKTSLLKVINDVIKPLSGTVKVGKTVKIGYFSQHSMTLDDCVKVIDFILDIASFIEINNEMISASKILERFLFDSSLQYTYISKLSGGQKRRLQLLSVLMSKPNLLILDEPTNDLDIITLSILEDYLLGFKGSMVIVSHDRYFMDKIIDKYLIIKDNNIIESNNYDIYLNEEVVKNRVVETKTYVKEKKIRFSYQESKEYETILDDIEKLKQEVEIVNDKINKEVDYVISNELSIKRDQLIKDIEDKEERWFYLEDIAEKSNNN